MTELHDNARRAGLRQTTAAPRAGREDASSEGVGPLIFTVGVIKAAVAFGAMLVAVVVTTVGGPDPIDIEPRILQRR